MGSKARFILLLPFLAAQAACIFLPIPHPRVHAYGVKGEVVDVDGNPLAGMRVVKGQGEERRETQTGPDGSFVISPDFGWHFIYFKCAMMACALSFLPEWSEHSVDQEPVLRVFPPGQEGPGERFKLTGWPSEDERSWEFVGPSYDYGKRNTLPAVRLIYGRGKPPPK